MSENKLRKYCYIVSKPIFQECIMITVEDQANSQNVNSISPPITRFIHLQQTPIILHCESFVKFCVPQITALNNGPH